MNRLLRTARLRFAWLLFVCALAAPACVADSDSPDSSDSPTGVITLVNGDSMAGRLCTSRSTNLDSAEMIEWLSDEFLDPFAFDIEAVKAIRFATPSATKPDGEFPEQEFIVQCVDGDVITGDIVDWDSETLVVQSRSLGDVTIRTDAIANLNRHKTNGRALVTFATALDDWKKTDWTATAWIEEGQNLVSDQAGEILNSDFDLSDRFVFDLELSWTGVANFVVAIATDPVADRDSSTDGWRLETVQNQLVVIREGTEGANIQLVADLDKQTTVRLIGYLDQTAGELRLFGPDGNQVAKIIDPSEGSIGSGFRVINRGDRLELRRLRILTVGEQEDREKIKLSDLTSAHLSRAVVAQDRMPVVFRLRGGIQISGNIAGVDLDHWTIQDDKYVGNLHIPLDQVRVIAMSTTEENAKRWSLQPSTLQDGTLQPSALQPSALQPSALQDDRRIGRLESNGRHHLGSFAESKKGFTGISSLRWQPVASSRASRWKPEFSGRVVYQTDPDTWKRSRRKLTTTPMLRRSNGKDFADLFLEKVDRVEARRGRRDQHVVHLRSGDIISCRVESIGKSGVYLSTSAVENAFVIHADIKAVELVPKAVLPNVSELKRQRLLTLPRLQKSSPPTHLLCSHDGDFLRCRLVRADHETIVVEVQMQELRIPRNRVSHIVWLHPNDSRSKGSWENRYGGLVQAVWPDGRRMTFDPTGSTKKTLHGINPVLGDCEVDLSKICRITLGNRIADEAADLVYAEWKLSPATLPLVMREFESGSKSVVDSPLVGTMAPEILLERLDGGEFELSAYRGQIVVLDFWASWSAPCMQTMPGIHGAISGFEPSKVVLVAINMEERRELVRDAIKRLDLDMVVALDVDGITVRPYRATTIPQTVIIDPSGKIAGVIVGGGKEAVSTLKIVVGELLNSQ